MTVSDNQACAKLKELSIQFEQDAERLEQTNTPPRASHVAILMISRQAYGSFDVPLAAW